jgi:predicted DNA-binding WGR domain protein
LAQVKSWKLHDPKAPPFPEDFDVVEKAVLQLTDIQSNHNKFYAIEIHSAGASFRVFTHYGRTDDLENDPDAGAKECRYFASLADAQVTYQSIYREKTSPRKGYKELSLASSRIGSAKARGTSSGQIDDATLKKAAEAEAAKKKAAAAPPSTSSAPAAPPSAPAPEQAAPPPSEPAVEMAPPPTGWKGKLKKLVDKVTGSEATPAPVAAPVTPAVAEHPSSGGPLHPKVADLVEYVYAEATNALSSTVAAKITAQGIETPLGILTLGQIQKGEAILQDLYELFQKKGKKKSPDDVLRLSGDFYTVVPHRIGRTRAAAQAAVIDTLEAFEQKQETLQLMKDMLQVIGQGEGNVLFESKSHAQYEALRCEIGWVGPDSGTFREIRDLVLNSQIKTKAIKVQSIYTIRREPEGKAFATHVDNQRLLFHGSRIKNWVGILSRGILLPKIVVSMGVNRTDAGWLGNGIYFGDAACTSAFYTSPGKRNTRFMSVARVALGRMKEFTKITYGLEGPPAGYHSCHGVRNKSGSPSQFADDEYVVYSPSQQRLEYLVEFRM